MVAVTRLPGMAVLVPALLLASLPVSRAAAGFDDGARYAFAASAATRSVYVIDLADAALAHTLQLQRVPDAVAVSDRLKALVISHRQERSLTLIDLARDSLTEIAYPLGIDPAEILMSPTGETLLVYDRARGTLQLHALRRRDVLLAADDVHTETAFSFAADGARIFWSDDSQGTINAIDLWGVRASLKLTAANSGLSAMSRSIDGTLGFVSDAAANRVYIVDLATFTRLAIAQAGSEPGRPWGTSDGRFMLVPNHGDGTVTAIATATGESVYTIATVDKPLSVSPGWLDTVAAAVGETGQIAFFDIDSGDVTARSEVTGRPLDGVVTSDSRTLGIPVRSTGAFYFFDMQRREKRLVMTLPPDIGPAALAISNNLCH